MFSNVRTTGITPRPLSSLFDFFGNTVTWSYDPIVLFPSDWSFEDPIEDVQAGLEGFQRRLVLSWRGSKLVENIMWRWESGGALCIQCICYPTACTRNNIQFTAWLNQALFEYQEDRIYMITWSLRPDDNQVTTLSARWRIQLKF